MIIKLKSDAARIRIFKQEVKKHMLKNHCEFTHHEALTEDWLESMKSMILGRVMKIN